MFARININSPPTNKKTKKKKIIIAGNLKKKTSNKFFGSKLFMKSKNPMRERVAIRRWGINFFRFFMVLEYQKGKDC
jgi:hypothetical protein